MTRITPASGATMDVGGLEERQPYKVQLAKVAWSKGKEQYGGEDRLTLDWRFEGGSENDTVRDWLSLRLGQQQSGQVSKLRMLLNALAEKAENTKVEWFDTETKEWGYEKDGPPFLKLTEGMEVVVQGKFQARDDGNGDRYVITTYQPLKAKKARPAGSRSFTPAPVADDQEPPF